MRLESELAVHSEIEELETLIDGGQELLRAVRFVGDEEDLYFWRIRKADWECGSSNPIETASMVVAGDEPASLTITETLSREVETVKTALNRFERAKAHALAQLQPAVEH